MDTKVTRQDGMSSTGKAKSSFEVKPGADLDVGSAHDGFRPLELMGISLAGCTAMDVISILRKEQPSVTAFEVKVHADRATKHPKVPHAWWPVILSQAATWTRLPYYASWNSRQPNTARLRSCWAGSCQSNSRTRSTRRTER